MTYLVNRPAKIPRHRVGAGGMYGWKEASAPRHLCWSAPHYIGKKSKYRFLARQVAWMQVQPRPAPSVTPISMPAPMKKIATSACSATVTPKQITGPRPWSRVNFLNAGLSAAFDVREIERRPHPEG
jgi:hypothetical protein